MNEKIVFPKLYTEFARYYDRLESQYRDYPRESEWLIGLLEKRNCKDVIDVSCGTGSHLTLMQKQDFNLYGIDASIEIVKLSKKKLAFGKEPSLVLADFLHIPFRKEIFDATLCMYWSLAGLNQNLVKYLFSEVASILRSGGMFVLDTENSEGIKESLLNSPYIDAFFTDTDENVAVIRANFSTKIESDLVDWRAYYLLEQGGVAELQTDRMNLRFYSKSQIELLLKETGFKTLQVASGPDGEYKENSPSLYFLAEKT
jgi:SAM-dependent methyltransferase